MKVEKVMRLYIFLFLHQTATAVFRFHIPFWLYIFLFLHQTATGTAMGFDGQGVVYLLIPTSNRNSIPTKFRYRQLYIFLFLHQTATRRQSTHCLPRCISSYSYIKPQRRRARPAGTSRCISSYSYIKPQQLPVQLLSIAVVYLLIPTSNRNFILITSCI